MTFNFEKMNKQIQAEADISNHFGYFKMYSFIINELTYGDIGVADEYMLSEYVGLNKQQLKRIKSEHIRLQTKTSKKLISGLRAF